MALIRFSRRTISATGIMPDPPDEEVKNTPSLFRADLDDATRFGGEITRAALGTMKLCGDKRFIVVDTKVHMLDDLALIKQEAKDTDEDFGLLLEAYVEASVGLDTAGGGDAWICWVENAMEI